ncbi:glycosyltransferase family 2 protein, partial [bacterium]|nr:glycosyltransferase family 2 protein [bacterium]
MTQDKEKIVVCVPVYKNYQYLKALFDSACSDKYDIEFFIFSNQSDFDTEKFCKIYNRRKGFKAEVVRKRMGFSGAVNKILDICTDKGYDKVIITHSDVLFHKNCIDTLVDFMDSNPEHIVASALDITRLKKVLQEFPEIRSSNLAEFRHSPEGIENFKNIISSIETEGSIPVSTTKFADLTTFIVRPKKLLDTVGYFDEAFNPDCGETEDMLIRLMQSGHMPVTVMNAPILHIKGRSFFEGGLDLSYKTSKLDYLSQKYNYINEGDMPNFNSLAEISKKPDNRVKIFDCFIVEDNLDLLEKRLKLLEDKVDFFIVAESGTSMDGEDKPLFLKENKDR